MYIIEMKYAKNLWTGVLFRKTKKEALKVYNEIKPLIKREMRLVKVETKITVIKE